MKISIITVCFNSEATIADSLQSLRMQNYPNFESVIIDGGSTDNTLAIVNQYRDVVKELISEPDLGIYDAMNKGILASSGDIIGILNSDDMLANNEVLNMIAQAFSKDETQCVHGDLVYVARNNPEKIIRYWKAGKSSTKKFFYGWMPPHPTFYIRRELIDQCGLYSTILGTAADYEFMLRIIVRHNIQSVYIPRILVKMRNGGVSNKTLLHRMKANINDRKAWQFNNLKPYFFTLQIKPLRKLHQYFMKVW